MRYSQIRTLYEKMVAAQAACSREWRISDTLVMCVEFDMYAAMSESHANPDHSDRDVRAQLGPMMRVSMFGTRAIGTLRMVGSDQLRLQGYSDAECNEASRRRRLVDDWMMGNSDELPPSTSSLIADRLRDRVRSR